MASATLTSTEVVRRTEDSHRSPRAELCPRCGGQLAVNQDGWKICHACGYASPPGTAPPARNTGGGIVTGTVATLREAR